LTLAVTRGLAGDCQGQTAPSVSTNSATVTEARAATTESVVLPKSVADPLEPMNRIIWTFNQGLMVGVVKPTAKAYRFIVRKPVRTGISNFGRNITYPGRLINNLLQGKWAGARHETDRFFCNTIAGAAGFVDVASKWKIPKSDADFGQTFGRWGWKPGCYLMLPIFGPSNERDAVGFAADSAANPLTYVAPYSFDASKPLTYLSPYTYYSGGVYYNNLTDTVDESVRFTQTEMDPYSVIQYSWTFVRKTRVANFQVEGEPDKASLETLQSVYFTFKDAKFPGRGKTHSVLIPTTGKKLKFTYWLQPENAPVVFIVPGLGSHRQAATVLALAELVFQNGFSAVSVSSSFNYEFMQHASTTAVPSYTPVDVQDLRVALTEIDGWLEKRYPNRLGYKALMGYSLGAFQSLFVAATASTNHAPLTPFNRYVALNPPVRLLYGVSQLDKCFQAPLAWPSEERRANLENTLLKVAALSKTPPAPQSSLPFDAIESRFLIGMTFRFILRDTIYCSQQRENQGVLEHRIRKLRRNPVYQEILQYSYQDYFEKFVVPYYQTRGVDLTDAATLKQEGDLRTYTQSLQANENVRLIVNRNDILLADEDLKWLETNFEADRLTLFEHGGHLGNLTDPAVQKAILKALAGLAPRQ
jgi:ABC-type transporter lipoprotein component MlaA